MPLIPVTTSGANEGTAEDALLRNLRSGSCYRKARISIKLTLLLETLGGAGYVMFAIITRRAPSPLALSAIFGAVLLLSFIAAEMALACFDVADAVLHVRLKQGDLG